MLQSSLRHYSQTAAVHLTVFMSIFSAASCLAWEPSVSKLAGFPAAVHKMIVSKLRPLRSGLRLNAVCAPGVPVEGHTTGHSPALGSDDGCAHDGHGLHLCRAVTVAAADDSS